MTTPVVNVSLTTIGESFVSAVAHQDVAKMKMILELFEPTDRKTLCNYRNRENDTPMYLASRFMGTGVPTESAAMNRLLLENGADPHWRWGNFQSALHAHCCGERLENLPFSLVELFIERGANIYLEFNAGVRPIDKARTFVGRFPHLQRTIDLLERLMKEHQQKIEDAKNIEVERLQKIENERLSVVRREPWMAILNGGSTIEFGHQVLNFAKDQWTADGHPVLLSISFKQ